MINDDILAGESKNIEFKAERPKDSFKYMKTVVAFSNGDGGKIIFGVDDKTRKIVGIPKEIVFSEIDAITTAISDNCEPIVIPDVYLKTVDDKTIIIAEISPGKQRPYYIKSRGIQNGTYIRVSGTSRLAGRDLTAEMYYEDEGRSYDRVIRRDLSVTEEEIQDLCQQMKKVAVDNARSDAQREAVKDITKNILLSWGLLAEAEDGSIHPTNGYVFLLGKDDFLSMIQCGMFKGNTRAVFVDKREYTGPLWEQINGAFQFVLRNIHLGAKLDGIYRKDIYELPPDSIRELIINAVMNCSFFYFLHIQVAVYEDRLEITSPGSLMPGVTLERMKEGYSKIRNRALAHAFSYMNLIEAWGSGIPKIMTAMREYGLREPEFIDMEIGFRVNLYRMTEDEHLVMQDTIRDTDQTIQDTIQDADQTIQDTIQDADQTIQDTIQDADQTIQDTTQGTDQAALKAKLSGEKLTDKEREILLLIKKQPHITQKEIALRLGWTIASTKYYTKKLKKQHVLERQGNNQKGQWKILIKI